MLRRINASAAMCFLRLTLPNAKVPHSRYSQRETSLRIWRGRLGGEPRQFKTENR